MGITTDLTAEVVKVFKENWTQREGKQVPETPDLQLGNDAVKLTGTVMYADLAGSTNMVMSYTPQFAAEIYKTYLNCACRIIRNQGGSITAFDGDRVMAVFIGDNKNTAAVRSALAINHAVVKILNPKVRKAYPKLSDDFEIRHGIGVDTSDLFIARTGIRGSNDLVWVGRAANYAAKLSDRREGKVALWITKDVHDLMNKSVRLDNQGASMWKEHSRSGPQGMTIYGSSFRWAL